MFTKNIQQRTIKKAASNNNTNGDDHENSFLDESTITLDGDMDFSGQMVSEMMDWRETANYPTMSYCLFGFYSK